MLHKAWSSIEEVPYCFWRSSVKFQGHTALKRVEFDPDWAFPDCNSSLYSPMAMKWCKKLKVAQKRCPIVLQGHPSNCTVTRAEKLTIWIQFEITRPVAAIKSLRFALFSKSVKSQWILNCFGTGYPEMEMFAKSIQGHGTVALGSLRMLCVRGSYGFEGIFVPRAGCRKFEMP